MANAAPTKPHIAMTGKAVWQCGDAHLSRSGRSWKQAYDRWLLASLRDAASVANLCQPAAPVTKKIGRPRKELMPMGWYVAEQAKGAQADLQPAAKGAISKLTPSQSSPTTAEHLDLVSALHVAGLQMPQLRQPGSDKPTASKPAPKASAIDQPGYHESMIRQAPAPTRREYSPSADLLRNMDRAAAVQKPLISISAIDRSAS